MDEKNKKWKLKIFIWFIFTEPIRVVKEFFVDLFYGVTKKSPSKTMIIFYLVLLFFTIFAENRFASMLCLIALIFLILRYIYKSGVYIHRWREVNNKKIGGNKNG